MSTIFVSMAWLELINVLQDSWVLKTFIKTMMKPNLVSLNWWIFYSSDVITNHLELSGQGAVRAMQIACRCTQVHTKQNICDWSQTYPSGTSLQTHAGIIVFGHFIWCLTKRLTKRRNARSCHRTNDPEVKSGELKCKSWLTGRNQRYDLQLTFLIPDKGKLPISSWVLCECWSC